MTEICRAVDIHAQYASTGQTIRWSVRQAVAESSGIQARDASAAMISELPIEEGAELQGSLGPAAMDELLTLAEEHLLPTPLAGAGIELGAGVGTLSAAVAQRPSVDFVFALEVCPNFVELVIPTSARAVLGDGASEVVPVLGSFDALELVDGSLDFAVEIDSLHHADDLGRVLSECARVLKPGGTLLVFDRAQPDDMPDAVRERMLDYVYPPEWIEHNGYPEGTMMTRRENGEHEIRFSEWLQAFDRGGFDVVAVRHFTPAVTARMALKAAVGYLPRLLRRRVMTMPVPRGYLWVWLRSLARRPATASDVVLGPKLTTGFALRRR